MAFVSQLHNFNAVSRIHDKRIGIKKLDHNEFIRIKKKNVRKLKISILENRIIILGNLRT